MLLHNNKHTLHVADAFILNVDKHRYELHVGIITPEAAGCTFKLTYKQAHDLREHLTQLIINTPIQSNQTESSP